MNSTQVLLHGCTKPTKHPAFRWASFAAMFALIACPSFAASAPRLGGPVVDGSVVRVRGCGVYLFISYHNEYALAQWLGGYAVRETEVLQTMDDQASFEREGRLTVTDLASGRAVDLFIEKAMLNNSDYAKATARYCH